jgi:hypothetical protein
LRRTYESVAHEVGISELDQHVLTNHAFASHNVNATYIAQAFPRTLLSARRRSRLRCGNASSRSAVVLVTLIARDCQRMASQRVG